MKIALVHELLTQDGGAERVFQTIAELFPQAPIFTLFYYPKNVNPYFHSRDIRPSIIQKFLITQSLKNRYNHLLVLLPKAIEQWDFSSFDAVISSSSALVKSVITPSSCYHLCYCHTPARYLWVESDEYIRNVRANPLFKLLAPYFLEKLRDWDKHTSLRPTKYLANSQNVQNRIRHFYGRESEVLYPFVELEKFSPAVKKDFFLTGGRLVAYKRFDVVVKAFNKLGMPLVVFGTGPQGPSLKAMVKNPKIRFVGKISDQERGNLFAEARAFIHPQEEDFGITLLESFASGTPVIAYGRGGALEIVDQGRGVLFDDQSWEAVADAVIHFDPSQFNPRELHSHAEGFSKPIFQKKFFEIFQKGYEEFLKNI